MNNKNNIEIEELWDRLKSNEKINSIYSLLLNDYQLYDDISKSRYVLPIAKHIEPSIDFEEFNARSSLNSFLPKALTPKQFIKVIERVFDSNLSIIPVNLKRRFPVRIRELFYRKTGGLVGEKKAYRRELSEAFKRKRIWTYREMLHDPKYAQFKSAFGKINKHLTKRLKTVKKLKAFTKNDLYRKERKELTALTIDFTLFYGEMPSIDIQNILKEKGWPPLEINAKQSSSLLWDKPIEAESISINYISKNEATSICKKLGIKNQRDYQNFKNKKKYRLPWNPSRMYKDEWEGWNEFLGTESYFVKNPVSKREASLICKRLGIRSVSEYKGIKNKKKYRLPADPDRMYKDEWEGWREFLGRRKGAPRFLNTPSKKEAMAICKELGIKSAREYKRRLEDRVKHRLPSNPNQTYKREWKGWNEFLGTEPLFVKKPVSKKEASLICKKLGIKNVKEYRDIKDRKMYRLPAHPNKAYENEWRGWREFLGTEKDGALEFTSDKLESDAA